MRPAGPDGAGPGEELPLAEQPLREFLARLSAREPGPAAGSAAAVAAAMAAGLAGKTARLSARQLGEAGRNVAAGARVERQTRADTSHNSAVGEGVEGGAGGGVDGGVGGAGEGDVGGEVWGWDADEVAGVADVLRERAVALAAEDAAGVTAALTSGTGGPADPSAVPRAIGEVADAVGQLATQLAEHGNPRLHADALAVGQLAAAARAMVDAVVRSNEGRRD